MSLLTVINGIGFRVNTNKTKDREQREPHKNPGVNSCTPEG